MTNGEPGRIYWSAAGQRFYQEGRRGAVARRDALGALRIDAQGRIRDQLGRFVPDAALAPPPRQIRRFINYDEQGRPFVTASIRETLTTREAYADSLLASNQQLTVRTVVRTPDGRAFVTYTSSRLGGRINMDRLDEQADRVAAGDLYGRGYSVATPSVGNITVRRDYLIQEITTQRGLQ